MLFFKRNPPPPLEKAIALIHEAIEIAYTYKRDKRFKPCESDTLLFEQLRDALWANHATADYIARCMRQRMDGEPEGAKKWHDKEVFDYHYPP